jgi:sugar/nucleoside kinase (ribokinase family)
LFLLLPVKGRVSEMPKVFSVGDLNVDVFLYTEEKPVSGTEKNVPEIGYTIGGNAANFCMALSGAGTETELVSIIGSDVFTPFLASELKRSNSRPVLFRSAEPNGVSVIFVSGTGERAILSNKGALRGLDSEMVRKRLLSSVRSGDIVFFGGYFHLLRMKKGFPRLLASLRKKGAEVFFDTTYDEHGKWEVKKFLRMLDTIFLNEVELKRISRRGSVKESLEWLFRHGAQRVVLKRGARGSESHSGKTSVRCAALPVKAVNATGAGDFFNAGYTYGAARAYGERAKLLCGNFLAAKKISAGGYFLPKGKSIEAYLDNCNLIEARKVKNYAEVSEAIAQEITEQLSGKPDSVFAFASGSTPLGAYRKLAAYCRKGKADFSEASLLGLDEYAGAREETSLRHQLEDSLLDKVNFRKENVHLFRGAASGHAAEIRRMDSPQSIQRAGFVPFIRHPPCEAEQHNKGRCPEKEREAAAFKGIHNRPENNNVRTAHPACGKRRGKG